MVGLVYLQCGQKVKSIVRKKMKRMGSPGEINPNVVVMCVPRKRQWMENGCFLGQER